MVNKPLLLIIALLLLVMPIKAAVDVDYVFKIDTTTDLKVSCLDSDYSMCDNSTACYMTVNYPNGSNMLNKVQMTYGASYYNYTMDGSKLNTKGEYTTTVSCAGVNNGFSSFMFEVTATGDRTTSEGKTIIAALIMIPVLLAFLLLKGSIALSEMHSPLKIFLFLLSLIMFWVSLHFGIISIVRFYNFPEIESLIGTTTYWFGLVFIVIFSYFIIYSIKVMFNAAAQKKKEKLEY